jgi:hypothetical protein
MELNSEHSLKVQQQLLRLCFQYKKITENENETSRFMFKMQDTFRDIFKAHFQTSMSERERVQLLRCHFSLINLPMGYAKKHPSGFTTELDGKTTVVYYEVITFSAFERLRELGYDMSEYETFSTIRFVGLSRRIVFGLLDIHKLPIFNDKSKLIGS